MKVENIETLKKWGQVQPDQTDAVADGFRTFAVITNERASIYSETLEEGELKRGAERIEKASRLPETRTKGGKRSIEQIIQTGVNGLLAAYKAGGNELVNQVYVAFVEKVPEDSE